MTIKSAAVLLSALLLLGCKSSPISSFNNIKQQSFIIIAKQAQAHATAQLKDGTLQLSAQPNMLSIQNWPLSKTPCSKTANKKCKTQAHQEFFPDGPTTWLEIKGQEATSWVVNSFQPSFRFGPWHISQQSTSMTIKKIQKQNSATSWQVKTNTIKEVQIDDHCTLLWSYKKALAQPASNISQDVAKQQSQLIIQCLKKLKD